MRKYSILILILIISMNIALLSNSVIERIEINPLNRALIYLSVKPDSYVGELSPSKQKITVRLHNSKTKNIPEISGSTGIIKNIIVNTFKNLSEIIIELNDKRGFTLNYLPYSKALMIEAFDWNKLSKEEDYYRLGLISFNDGLINEAEVYFKKSASSDIPNSYFFLGLIYLTKGKTSESIDFFLLAEKNNCNIADNYAGLSEAYRILNDAKKSYTYKLQFQKKTGIAEISEFNIIPNQLNESVEEFEPSFLSSSFAFSDSISLIRPTIELTKGRQDSTFAKKEPEIIETPIVNSQENNLSSNQLPEWINNGLLYIFIILFLFITFIISIYKKWRKEQIQQLKKMSNAKFKENLEQARKNAANSKQMANIYQKYEKTTNNEEKAQDENIRQKSTLTQNIKSKKINEIEILAKNIISEKQKLQSENEAEKDKNIMESNQVHSNPLSFKKINPNLELALHLQNQNIKQKQKKLSEIDLEDISHNENISELAKKAGIDTGSLKAKKVINELLKDEKAKNNLSKKFLQQVLD